MGEASDLALGFGIFFVVVSLYFFFKIPSLGKVIPLPGFAFGIWLIVTSVMIRNEYFENNENKRCS